MDPATLVPIPDTIPISWGWFEFLLLLTFFCHLIFMNAMLGTTFIALLRELRAKKTGQPCCQEIANKITYAIAFAVNFGVAPLLFLQVLYGQFMYTSSVLMGGYWLSIIGLVIIAYYSAYYYKLRYEAGPEQRIRALSISLVLMLVVGFLFTCNMTLMQTPDAWLDYFKQPGGTFLNLEEPTLLPRYLHFVVASIAVGGLSLALLAYFQMKKGDDTAKERFEVGMKWFTFGSVVEAGTGIPFLFSLPHDISQLFVGASLLHTLIFLAAMVTTVAGIIYGYKEKIWHAVSAMSATVFLMILVRELTRQAYLAPYFKPADLTVVPQYSPFFVFLVVLVAGLAVVVYMLQLAAQAHKEVRP